MVKNSDALEKALRGGLRAVEREARDVAPNILRAFKLDVSVLFPPASNPGEPPALRTGKYRHSLSAEVRGTVITIKSSTILSLWLEFGTYRDGRPYMLPRPHWRTKLPLHAQEFMVIPIRDAFVNGERSVARR